MGDGGAADNDDDAVADGHLPCWDPLFRGGGETVARQGAGTSLGAGGGPVGEHSGREVSSRRAPARVGSSSCLAEAARRFVFSFRPWGRPADPASTIVGSCTALHGDQVQPQEMLVVD